MVKSKRARRLEELAEKVREDFARLKRKLKKL